MNRVEDNKEAEDNMHEDAQAMTQGIGEPTGTIRLKNQSQRVREPPR